jgi:hypothetical protein
MNDPNGTSGVWRKALVKLGLAYPPEGAPRYGTASRSRYGAFVSARIDQDIDELRAELELLKRATATTNQDEVR